MFSKSYSMPVFFSNLKNEVPFKMKKSFMLTSFYVKILPACGNFCRILITFVISLYPIQFCRTWSGSILFDTEKWLSLIQFSKDCFNCINGKFMKNPSMRRVTVYALQSRMRTNMLKTWTRHRWYNRIKREKHIWAWHYQLLNPYLPAILYKWLT